MKIRKGDLVIVIAGEDGHDSTPRRVVRVLEELREEPLRLAVSLDPEALEPLR